MTRAHVGNPTLVGRNRFDEQDAEGNREKLERMKKEKAFWQNYKFTDPLTHKSLPKTTYAK
jgi:cytochrome c